MERLLIIAMGLWFLAPSPTNAFEQLKDQGQYHTYFYKTGCGQYAQDRKLPKGVGAHASDESYVAGWLSAYNAIVPGGNIQGDTRIDDTLLWLDHFCLDHPFSTMNDGLEEFTRIVAPGLAGSDTAR
jgi:hypothetical protein